MNTPLFDQLEVTDHGPIAIDWKFSMFAAALMSDNDRYALMRKEDLKLCRSGFEYPFSCS